MPLRLFCAFQRTAASVSASACAFVSISASVSAASVSAAACTSAATPHGMVPPSEGHGDGSEQKVAGRWFVVGGSWLLGVGV